MPDRLRILFAGSGEFGLPALKQLLEAGHEVAAIYSQPDRPAGRGRKEIPTPIAQWALAQGLPVVRTANINAEPLPPADLLVVIAFGQKISPQVSSHPRLGSINLHASLLPKCRGAAPINWTLIRGESLTGNSVIRLAPKMDAGAVLAQSRVEIGDTETAGELHDRLSLDGGALVLKVLADLAAGRAVETPQDESLATLAPKMARESTTLRWKELSALEAACRIRGFYPWPGCRVALLDAEGLEKTRVTLARAVAQRLGCEPQAAAGVITAGGAIATCDGEVEILELQPEGRGLMTMAAYRNGHPWQAGWRLESVV